VRRAFFSMDYEHRRGWIEQRIAELAAVFSIDICAGGLASDLRSQVRALRRPVLSIYLGALGVLEYFAAYFKLKLCRRVYSE
jgi:hypothetical protein